MTVLRCHSACATNALPALHDTQETNKVTIVWGVEPHSLVGPMPPDRRFGEKRVYID